MLLTVRPGLSTFTVEFETKPEPARLALMTLPGAPLFGVSPVRVGATAADVMINAAELLVPPAAVTDTFAKPDAVGDNVNVAVI